MTETPGWSAPGWSTPQGAPEAEPVDGPGYPSGGTGGRGGRGEADSTPAFRPGVVPLRPLSLGELLDGAFTTIRRHPLVTFGAAASVVALQFLLQMLIGLVMRDVGGIFRPISLVSVDDSGDEADASISAAGAVSSISTFVLTSVLTALVAGAITLVVADAVLGRQVRGADIWRRTRERVWALLGASLVAGLLPFLPIVAGGILLAALAILLGDAGIAIGVLLLLAGIVLAVYVWPPMLLTTPALMLERIKVSQALRRSFRLVRRSWWRVWGIGALATLITGFVSGMVSGPATVISLIAGDGGGLAPILVATIGTALATIITLPFIASVCTLLYIDRRMRAEALDLELVRAAQAEASTAAL